MLLVRSAIGFGAAATADAEECADAALGDAVAVAARGARFQIARVCTVLLLGWHKRSSSTEGRTLPTTTGTVSPNSERTRSDRCVCPLLHPVLSNAAPQPRPHMTSRIASQMLPTTWQKLMSVPSQFCDCNMHTSCDDGRTATCNALTTLRVQCVRKMTITFALQRAMRTRFCAKLRGCYADDSTVT